MALLQKGITKIKKVIHHPLPFPLMMMQLFPFLTSDRFFLKLLFRHKLGMKLNLTHPQTYNEKLQWLKLNYRKPKMVSLVDKYEVKKYVAEKVGEQYIIPTLGIWDSFSAIDFEKLPHSFVLKATHDQGSVLICRNKNKFDYKQANAFLSNRLRRNYYHLYREWPYKEIKPRIIAEKMIVDKRQNDLKDFKFFCFHGEIKLISIHRNRNNKDLDTTRDFYNPDLRHLDITLGYEQSGAEFEKMDNYEEMVKIVKELSHGFPHIRIDLYNTGKRIYFGEMTFYPAAGLKPIKPEQWDYRMGSYIDLNGISKS